MGFWSVLSVQSRHAPLNTPSEFGTNWYVTYRLQYRPSLFGKFVEPPKMAWDEVIMYNNYQTKECWSFSGNFYTRKPDSPTMEVWAQRYFRAYLAAHNQPFTKFAGLPKGHSKLFDAKGQPVRGADLGTHPDPPSQNKAVQAYLQRHGGILEIEVHDIPNMIKPTAGQTKHVERVLIFNCGVEGGGPRAKGWQHIIVDSAQPAHTWTYQFQTVGSPPGLKTTGLQTVPDPTPQSNLLPTGGIW